MIRFSLQYYPEPPDLDKPEHLDFKLMRLREMSSALSTLRQMISLIDEKLLYHGREVPAHEFSSGKWLSADEKRKILKQWRTFIAAGFPERLFVSAVYEHLHLHCGYIAHTNRNGYWSEYFCNREFHRHAEEDGIQMRPVPLTFPRWDGFLRQFTIWGEYDDLNTAMMSALKAELQLLVKDILVEAGTHLASDMVRSYELYLQTKKTMSERAADLRKQAEDVSREAEALTVDEYTKNIREHYTDLFGEDLPHSNRTEQLSLV